MGLANIERTRSPSIALVHSAMTIQIFQDSFATSPGCQVCTASLLLDLCLPRTAITSTRSLYKASNSNDRKSFSSHPPTPTTRHAPSTPQCPTHPTTPRSPRAHRSTEFTSLPAPSLHPPPKPFAMELLPKRSAS